MSTVRYLSTREEVPPGFESRVLTKRDLLSGSVAVLVASPEELRKVVGDFEARMRGVVVALGGPLRFEQLGPWLWRLLVPPDQLRHLRELIGGVMQAVEQGARLQDERLQLELEYRALRADLSETRRVSYEATKRLQRQLAVVTRLNRDLDQRLKEQIANQAEREHLEEQLRQSQKLEAVGHLAGGIAHDFNNLLVAILGHTELALHDLDEESPLRVELEHVSTAAQRAAALTQQLLAFSRRQILQPVDLDLAEVVDKMVTMLSRILGEEIELRVSHAASPTTVRADRAQLEQVLLNLCVNARDAMPRGGRIDIETGREEFDAAFCTAHPWATPSRYATLRVRDTGYGMDEGTVRRVFEPFFTTKPVGEGTGLGLAMVYGIVTQHGGHVAVSSRVGEGTSFLIHLPAVEREPDEPTPREPASAKGGGETILLVEDDPRVRRLCQRVLSAAGYTVLVAENGEDALRVFAEHEGEVDLAFLDLVMPHLSGVETQRRLRRRRPGLKCLFSSGYGLESVSVTVDEGCQLLQKPFMPQELLEKVREVLDSDPPAGV